MNPLLILAAAATLGVEVGWQPLAEGGHEYTIQLEPQLLDVLKRGSDIVSEVPPQLEIRRYRVTIGTGRLARIDGQPPRIAQPEEQSPKPGAAGPPSGDDVPNAPAESGIAATAQPTPAEPAGSPIETHAADGPRHDAVPPAALSVDHAEVKPLGDAQPAAHQVPVEEHSAEKPSLDSAPAGAEPQRPWLPFSVAVVLLCCSLGGNLYLGWIAAEARKRYRQVAAKLRGATETSR